MQTTVRNSWDGSVDRGHDHALNPSLLGGDDSAGAEGYAEGVWARYRAIADKEAWDRLASYRLGIACGLETSTMKNRRFYERRGFEQASEIILPGGPDTWFLCRPKKGMPAK